MSLVMADAWLIRRVKKALELQFILMDEVQSRCQRHRTDVSVCVCVFLLHF